VMRNEDADAIIGWLFLIAIGSFVIALALWNIDHALNSISSAIIQGGE